MPPGLLIAVAAGAAGLILLLGGGAPSGPRKYTTADLPKLRELLLEKSYLGRELRICLQKQTEHSLFTTDQYIALGVGLFTGVATLNPQAAMTAARTAQAGLAKLKGSSTPCDAELKLTMQQLANHDQTCAELGLPKEVTYEQVQAIAAGLGGFAALDEIEGRKAWNNCVSEYGQTRCTSIWKTPGHGSGPPVHDPKTGLAPLS